MEFLLYSILISLLYIYSGIGLTFLLCPKNFEKYTLYLSPFVGLTYLSYFSRFFVYYSTFGADVYAKWLLIPPIIFLITATAVKKMRIGELLWPFRKENLLLIAICVLIFTVISTPYLLRVDGLNTITLGNNDIIHNAAVSKFITKSSLIQSPINVDGFFIEAIKRSHFAAYISTAIPSSIFSIDSYKIQTIVTYLFYIFSLPVIFLIGFEIFKYNKIMAMIATLLSGLSFHLIYINYQGFLGQIIGDGMFLSLFLVTLYPILNCNKFSCFVSHSPLMGLFTIGLFISYSLLVPLFFIPLFVYILLVFISTKSTSYFLNILSFISFTLFATFIISPFLFVDTIKELSIYSTISFGWNMPLLFPDWVFGLISANDMIHVIRPGFMPGFTGYNMFLPSPIVYRVVLSALIILIVIASLIHLFKKERQVFYMSISYISFILLLYIYLTLKEVSSPSFTGEGYKAYKLITYFIPIILLSGLSYFRNFRILSITKIKKTQILSMVFLVLLIVGNMWSASEIIKTNYYLSGPINENIIDLQKITKMDNISSINIVEPQFWDQMWMYYFLFMEKKVYLEYSTYYPASPLLGEWTLQKSKTNDIITLVYIGPKIIELNRDYNLVENNLPIEAVFGKGWYGIESNQYVIWRWTGEKDETPTIRLDVQKEELYVDFFLNYWSLDANNNFSVFLDDKKIKDCQDENFCVFNDIYISKGKHVVAFKIKLPPRLPGNGDSRRLGYAFSNISMTTHNIKTGETN